jgi:hypothetical protein
MQQYHRSTTAVFVRPVVLVVCVIMGYAVFEVDSTHVPEVRVHVQEPEDDSKQAREILNGIQTSALPMHTQSDAESESDRHHTHRAPDDEGFEAVNGAAEWAAGAKDRAAVVSVVELLALPLSTLLERAWAEGLEEDAVEQLMHDSNPHDALALALHQLLTMQLHHPWQASF